MYNCNIVVHIASCMLISRPEREQWLCYSWHKHCNLLLQSDVCNTKIRCLHANTQLQICTCKYDHARCSCNAVLLVENYRGKYEYNDAQPQIRYIDQSTICNQQFAINSLQSTICNPKFAINNLRWMISHALEETNSTDTFCNQQFAMNNPTCPRRDE